MSYEIEYEERPNFLVATVTGDNNPETVAAYLREVLAECRRRFCVRLLIDERLEGQRLPVDDVFELASEGALNALGFFQAVAFVDPKMGDMAQFAETVALNRGMPIRAFANVQDAENWLSTQVEGTDEQKIFSDDPS